MPDGSSAARMHRDIPMTLRALAAATDPQHFAVIDDLWTSWLGHLVWLGVTLAFSYIVWYTAVQRIGSARTALYSNLTPIVAMIVATVWLKEPITRTQVIGATLILSGLAVARLGAAGGAGNRVAGAGASSGPNRSRE